MADLKRVWGYIVQGLHSFFVYIDGVSAGAAIQLGYVMVVLAILLKVYQKRRRFYRNLKLEDDWKPTYGSVVGAKLEDFIYGALFWLCLFAGVMMLSQRYMPVLFDDVFRFLIGMTGEPVRGNSI